MEVDGVSNPLAYIIPAQESEDIAAVAAALIHARRLRAQLKVRWHVATLIGVVDLQGRTVPADPLAEAVRKLDREIGLLERLLVTRQLPGPPGPDQAASVTAIGQRQVPEPTDDLDAG